MLLPARQFGSAGTAQARIRYSLGWLNAPLPGRQAAGTARDRVGCLRFQ